MKYQAYILFILLLTTVGCVSMGPDYTRPDTGVKLPENFLGAEGNSTQQYVTNNKWWEEFGDTRLNQVVANVVVNNPDIQKAAASVMEARAIVGQTRAGQYPTLDLSANGAKQQQSVVDPLTGNNVSVKTDTFSFTLPASFELDLWGRLSRATEAARADLLAAEGNRRTIAQSLIAESVSQYFNILSLEEQLKISRQLTQTYKDNLELIEARYRRGLTSVLEVQQARRSLAQSEAEIPSLAQAVGKARQALAVLQGSYPEAEAIQTAWIVEFELPPPIPAGLPSELLNRRPDIKAAEAALEAASARIGVAKASRFPQISLTASFGYTSNELHSLFDPENELWRIAGGVFQPVFDAGKRKSAQRAAEARYQKQLAAYAKTLLDAFAEVEGALLTRKQQIERHSRLVIFSGEAKATLETALDRYQRGLTDYLNVLDAQQANFQAELSLVKTRYTIYTNRVAIYRALGGGWDDLSENTNRSDKKDSNL